MTDYIEKINAKGTTYTIGGDTFDGQWINSSIDTIASNITLSGNTYTQYDLSEYLPNDDYDYEVFLTGESNSVTSTKNRTCQLVFISGYVTSATDGWRTGQCTSRTAQQVIQGGTVILPMLASDKYNSKRYITVWTKDSDYNNTNVYIRAKGYRRLGKNPKTWYAYSANNTIYYSKKEVPEEGDTAYTPFESETGSHLYKFTYATGGRLGIAFSSGSYVGYATRESSYDINNYNYISNINTKGTLRPVGGKAMNGAVNIFTSDMSGLITGTKEHNILFSDTTLATNSLSSAYSVANCIPNDGYDYELCLSFWGRPPETSGKTINLYVGSGSASTSYQTDAAGKFEQCCFKRIARTNASYGNMCIRWVPISHLDKYIKFKNSGSGTATFNCMVHGYRRIGINSYDSNGSYGTNVIKNLNNCKFGGYGFDDSWNSSYSNLFSSVTLPGTSTATPRVVPLSDYLPDDNYDYMVDFTGWALTPSGSGSAILRVLTGTHTYDDTFKYGARWLNTEYHSESIYATSGSFRMPIFANDRNITVINTSTNVSGNCGLAALAYKRLGINE